MLVVKGRPIAAGERGMNLHATDIVCLPPVVWCKPLTRALGVRGAQVDAAAPAESNKDPNEMSLSDINTVIRELTRRKRAILQVGMRHILR